MITNENKFRAIERLRRTLMLLSVASIAVLAYWNRNLPQLGFYISLTIIIFSLCLFTYNYLTAFAYFSFEEVGDVFIFKSYATGNLSFKRMKISIAHNDFAGYEIHKSFFGKNKKLKLFEMIKNKHRAAYPLLSISTLSSEQQNKLLSALNKHISK
jgi:hypothetical protein